MNDINELWDRAKMILITMLQNTDEGGKVERYVKMITAITAAGSEVVFSTSNSYAAELLSNEYAERIRNCMILAGADKNLKIRFEMDAASKPKIVAATTSMESREGASAPAGGAGLRARGEAQFISTMPLLPEYTFDEFVRGPSNSLATATAISIANNPGQKGYNPFFIHGGTGLGKTHLMQAIGNEIRRRNPTASVCYLTAEQFLNEFVNYLAKQDIESFRQRYRNVDILLVDDVQFIANRPHFREEFFNTFNALYYANKQIVMTSDVSPKKLQNFDERLISRFEGGMVQEIESPSYETRLAILKKKSENLPNHIPENALKFIADNIRGHVRAMEGALAKVNIMVSLTPNMNLNDEVLTRLLSDLIEKEQTLKKITIEEIQNKVCDQYKVTMAQLLSTDRTQSIVTPRQLAMYISRKYTSKSLPEIAKMFDKTHATILHGVKTISKRLEVEPDLQQILNDILGSFGYSPNDNID